MKTIRNKIKNDHHQYKSMSLYWISPEVNNEAFSHKAMYKNQSLYYCYYTLL